MKYQKGLKKTKDFLRTSPEPTIKEVCREAGLTDKETEIIILRFRKGKLRFHAADEVGMSKSRFSIKFTLILKILKAMLIKLGFIDGDD